MDLASLWLPPLDKTSRRKPQKVENHFWKTQFNFLSSVDILPEFTPHGRRKSAKIYIGREFYEDIPTIFSPFPAYKVVLSRICLFHIFTRWSPGKGRSTFLLRKRIMAAVSNHLLLHMELNSFIDSCILSQASSVNSSWALSSQFSSVSRVQLTQSTQFDLWQQWFSLVNSQQSSARSIHSGHPVSQNRFSAVNIGKSKYVD